ncbi:MAG: carbohydrate ABC transporter permease [Faecousia sp.]
MQRAFPLFILPTLAAFFIGFLWPFLLGIYRSFSSFSSPIDFTWNGFTNYVKAFQDEGFRYAFGFTTIYAVVSIILINVFAFALAYALTQKLKGSNIFRTVFFMPNLIGGIVLAYIWKLIFDAVLGSSYMTNANVGFWTLVVLVAWQQIGYIMIIYIAGLQAVPEDMLEAAKIDGANRWQTLWRVTIPNVMPSITICMFLTLTNSFKLFDQNFALTGGSPKLPGTRILQTEMLALHIYNTNNINNKWKGTAQAEAVVFFIIVAVLALIQLRATRKKEVQQ